ncbi:saccharopine dehydrogenase family protein [Aquirhabdus parva]|uniref:Saccharopine dehydrogenase NADP binding domain-containing protein n=1 Tax=Aquirhabdus parva TaxID=2283318 RepID=A0A345P964_9GAMM|nr:saccharopine dehydrogenase NADP-binding domain-containing protein [Aquirhabdus parva]AXI03823.1 hypothetical protein HYN46_13860 [Aquirhabdus parva]
MAKNVWLIYGANGYSGELIAREAVKQGLTPVLAGRSLAKLEPLAAELNLSARAFDLADPKAVAAALKDVSVVLNCAGPFAATAALLIEGCIKAKTHYLDITGEIAVFEHAQGLHARAKRAGAVICPGVGFDVIPTDCVAAALKAAQPDATHLALAFKTASPMSPGTAKTAVEGLQLGGMVRENGVLKKVPQGFDIRDIDFGRGPKSAMTIPWGDVSTAFWSTKIPNISVYIPVPKAFALSARLTGSRLDWLWKKPAVIDFLKAQIEKRVPGPDTEKRAGLPTYVWGESSNARGEKKTARLKMGNVYDVTVYGALAIVSHLLQESASDTTTVALKEAGRAGGYFTPSQLMGYDFVSSLPDAGPIEIQ